jgi:hypothetical protein
MHTSVLQTAIAALFLNADDCKEDLLDAYINKIVGDMEHDELVMNLKEFIDADMNGLPKSEILDYIRGVCPEIIGEE